MANMALNRSGKPSKSDLTDLVWIGLVPALRRFSAKTLAFFAQIPKIWARGWPGTNRFSVRYRKTHAV